MIILGITNAETSSACIFQNGELLSAVSEERFTRIKMDESFPQRSIEFCLADNSLTLEDVDIVSYSWSKGFHEDLLEEYIKRYDISDSESKKLILERYTLEKERDIPRREEFWGWVDRQSFKSNVVIEDFYHHEAHAYSAALNSGFDRSAVMTCDGRGDYESLTFWIFDRAEGMMKKVFSSSSVDSLGFFYGRITGLLGFTPCRHEGKVTGLAAHGNPATCIDLMKKMIAYKQGKISSNLGSFYRPFYTNYSDELINEIRRYRPEDVAAAAQKHLEDCLASLVVDLYSRHNLSNFPLSLAGGVFANVKVNQRLKELNCVKKVFVQPQMGDGGLCVGAAIGSLFKRKVAVTKLESLALGPKGGDRESIDELLKSLSGYVGKKFNEKELTNEIIQHLKADKVIGLVRGKMEFGPRALCRRSILYRTNDQTCNDWLNKRMSRTEFMPFAPVMTQECGKRFLKEFDVNDQTLKFMTSTINVTEEFVAKSPAVTHIDFTARPQIVDRKDDPWLWELLTQWSLVSGEVGLINTSFNKHEEPIVLSYEDAFSNLIDGVIDILVLDDTIVIKE